jgi:hypothetical protein
MADAEDQIDGGLNAGGGEGRMSKYPIEHYKTLLIENKKWLGQQAVDILEHYAALEAKLEAMERDTKRWLAINRITHNDLALAIEQAIAAAQEEQ